MNSYKTAIDKNEVIAKIHQTFLELLKFQRKGLDMPNNNY